MTAELLRVEQYVEMVLHYLRLESESTDYVLRETEIDPLLRQAARRYAPDVYKRQVCGLPGPVADRPGGRQELSQRARRRL